MGSHISCKGAADGGGGRVDDEDGEDIRPAVGWWPRRHTSRSCLSHLRPLTQRRRRRCRLVGIVLGRRSMLASTITIQAEDSRNGPHQTMQARRLQRLRCMRPVSTSTMHLLRPAAT